VPLQNGVHDPPLYSATTSVNQTHFREAGGVGGMDILLDDRTDVGRAERVEVERILDRELVNGLGLVISSHRAP
jgi:hypothetical protein